MGMGKCWINGQWVQEDQASISIRDTGLLHGAGVFTTMRAYHCTPFRILDHMRRLRRSCEALFVPLQFKDDELISAAGELLKHNALNDARLRLTVTRGVMSQDPLHGMRLQPVAILTATALEPYPHEYYQKGMTVLAYDRQKLNPYDMQAGHKTLDYFSRFAGLRDAASRGAGEALWFNVHNYLQSGSVSNVFIAKGGRLITPPTQSELEDSSVSARTPYPRSNVLPGIVRQCVIEIARQQNIPVDLAPIDIDMLLSAEECFLTNSIMEVMPVCRVERKALGAERPGDLTRQLAMLYRSQVDEPVKG